MTKRPSLRVLNNDRSMYSLFSDFLPPARVVVIPDSRYQELQREEAQRQVTVLESKINRYSTLVKELEAERDSINKSAGLLVEGAEKTE